MATGDFFEETREQSIVKSTLVEKYFETWANIIGNAQIKLARGKDNRIAYVDLFAGPGRYKDGLISTPLKVLQKAIANEQLRQRLVTIFNDRDPEHASNLRAEIQKISGLDLLTHQPDIWNREIGDNVAKEFADKKKIPILAFIDPWGYKGLTLKLVDAFLRDWGCDCIFFFNYARINAGLSNPMVKEHMSALFGEKRADELDEILEGMSPAEREATIVESLANALKAFGHRYVLPFCFKNDAGTRTKHHLILVTKHFKGYDVMKGIMAKASTSSEQGVPSFAYCPADSRKQLLLFQLSRPLDDLREELPLSFAGKTLTMAQIYEQHSVDRPYIRANYKAVLADMEKAGTISTAGRKSNRGFADEIVVTFPSR